MIIHLYYKKHFLYTCIGAERGNKSENCAIDFELYKVGPAIIGFKIKRKSTDRLYSLVFVYIYIYRKREGERGW